MDLDIDVNRHIYPACWLRISYSDLISEKDFENKYDVWGSSHWESVQLALFSGSQHWCTLTKMLCLSASTLLTILIEISPRQRAVHKQSHLSGSRCRPWFDSALFNWFQSWCTWTKMLCLSASKLLFWLRYHPCESGSKKCHLLGSGSCVWVESVLFSESQYCCT